MNQSLNLKKWNSITFLRSFLGYPDNIEKIELMVPAKEKRPKGTVRHRKSTWYFRGMLCPLAPEYHSTISGWKKRLGDSYVRASNGDMSYQDLQLDQCSIIVLSSQGIKRWRQCCTTRSFNHLCIPTALMIDALRIMDTCGTYQNLCKIYCI